MRCNLLAFAVHLTDVAEGEGGFCVIRGSHKSNFPCPRRMRRYEAAVEHAYQPAVRAGDVVVFTEATTHGTLPWRGKAQRRNIIYRFSPATCAYGRGYVERGGWPEAYTRGMTEAQRATMEMPYHPRLNRVAVKPDAAGRRNQRRGRSTRSSSTEPCSRATTSEDGTGDAMGEGWVCVWGGCSARPGEFCSIRSIRKE